MHGNKHYFFSKKKVKTRENRKNDKKKRKNRQIELLNGKTEKSIIKYSGRRIQTTHACLPIITSWSWIFFSHLSFCVVSLFCSPKHKDNSISIPVMGAISFFSRHFRVPFHAVTMRTFDISSGNSRERKKPADLMVENEDQS